MKTRKSNTTLKINTNIVNLIILFSCFTFFIFGCKNGFVEIEPKSISLNLPALIDKTPQEVEKIVGKPKIIYPIENSSSTKIGEGRRYDLTTLENNDTESKKPSTSNMTDDYILTVDYYQGKSVYLYAHFPVQREEPLEFGRRCGFDLKNKTPVETKPGIIRWSGELNGISFLNVILNRNYDTTAKNEFYACECETQKIPRYK